MSKNKNKKTFDITIKQFSKTKLPKAEAPETWVMDNSVNFGLSEDDFKYLISKLNTRDPKDIEIINKLGVFAPAQTK